MKKTLISLAALAIAMPVMAATDCAYSPLQNLIRNVRKADEITTLMNSGVVFSEKTRCGGSLMQLAILRGNPQVLQALLQQDPSRANEMVELQAYPIQGAPKEIPLLLFAAYHAPNGQMIELLVNSGADIAKTDTTGRNLLWYMDQNPVLRNTELYDELNRRLLSSLVPSQQKRPIMQLGGQPAQVGGVVSQDTMTQKQPKSTVMEANQEE